MHSIYLKYEVEKGPRRIKAEVNPLFLISIFAVFVVCFSGETIRLGLLVYFTKNIYLLHHGFYIILRII